MPEFRVTASQLRQKAQELTQLNNSLNTEINNLQQSESNVCSMWEGEAKNAFHNAFSQDKNGMLNFKQAIDQYVQALIQIAESYERAEAQNVQIATTRV